MNMKFDRARDLLFLLNNSSLIKLALNTSSLSFVIFITTFFIYNLRIVASPIANVTINKTSPPLYAYENNSEYVKFGPLRININTIRTKKNSLIVQAYNYDKKPIYLAINCPKYSINVTDSSLKWKGWISADKGFEFNMIRSLCKL